MSCPNSEPGEAGLGRECAGKAGKARLATPQASTSCPLSCSVFKEVLTPLPGLLPKSRVSRPHLKYSVWTVLTLSPVPQLHGFPQCSGSSPAGWALPPEPAHPSSPGMGLAGTGPWVLESQVPWELLLPKWEEALKNQGTKVVHPPGGATQRGLQGQGPRPCGGVFGARGSGGGNSLQCQHPTPRCPMQASSWDAPRRPAVSAPVLDPAPG